MSSIVSGMHKDIVNAMKTRDSEIDLLVRGRDDEVNRQYFLIVRLIRTAMMDRRLASSLWKMQEILFLNCPPNYQDFSMKLNMKK